MEGSQMRCGLKAVLHCPACAGLPAGDLQNCLSLRLVSPAATVAVLQREVVG